MNKINQDSNHAENYVGENSELNFSSNSYELQNSSDSDADESFQDPLSLVAANYDDQEVENTEQISMPKWELGGFLGEDENDVLNKRCSCKTKSHPSGSRCRKPPYSYTSLIAMAIQASPEKKASLDDIFSFISEHFPYYKIGLKLWQNSIKHILALTKFFVRIPGGTVDYWTLGVPYSSNAYEYDRRLESCVSKNSDKAVVNGLKLQQGTQYGTSYSQNFNLRQQHIADQVSSSTGIGIPSGPSSGKSFKKRSSTAACHRTTATLNETVPGFNYQQNSNSSFLQTKHHESQHIISNSSTSYACELNKPTTAYTPTFSTANTVTGTSCNLASGSCDLTGCGITHPVDMSCFSMRHYIPIQSLYNPPQSIVPPHSLYRGMP